MHAVGANILKRDLDGTTGGTHLALQQVPAQG